MNQYIDIGQRLKEFALKEFLSVANLEKKLGMTPKALSQYVTGRNKPGPKLLGELKGLKCDIEWLLTGRSTSFDQAIQNHTTQRVEYKIVASVPAGIAEVQDYDWYETAPLDYHPENHAFIKVDQEFGYSMMPTIAPGDLVLINFNVKPKNGDLVAARWDETKGALKIYSENPDIPNMAVLTSYNQAIAPIFVSKKKVKIYKVVLIKKNN